ncbi:hypothetical protein SDC9_196130 [bioreactor metagenome]|uniref:Uncharacterized protein n=1 Tax=bioreactor metagenome TaxID=1076179 RepID=A0A645ICG2_9ZZZZ
MGQHQAGVGENDGEGSFQLMGGVGHKAALLLPGLFHRAKGQPGQCQADKKEAGQSRGEDQQAGQDQIPQGGALPAAVGEGDME